MIVTNLEQISREEQSKWFDKPYSFDVETTGLKYTQDSLIGVAFYVDGKSYYFVISHSTGEGDDVKQYMSVQDVVTLLAPVMSQTHVTCCMHNAKFDLHFIKRYNFPLRSRLFDTLMAAQLLDENRRNGLKSLTSLVDQEHASYSSYAEYRQWPKDHPYAVSLDKFADYAMKDVLVTFKLYEMFRKQLPKDSFRGVTTEDVFNNLWMPMVSVLQEMEERGFVINVDEARQLKDELFAESEEYRTKVEQEGIKHIMSWIGDYEDNPQDIPEKYLEKVTEDDEVYTNAYGQMVEQYGIMTPVIQKTPRSLPRKIAFKVSSSDQLRDMIFENIQVPREADLKFTPGGDISVDADNLETLTFYLKDETPEIITSLLEWRKRDKFIGTYLNTFINDTDEEGAIHAFFNMAVTDRGSGGTVTGRLSSSSPNLQNIPSRGELGNKARSLFVARPGHKLIAADYSNMESVVFAHFSGDEQLTKAFNENLDVHALTACGIYNKDYDHFVDQYRQGNLEYDTMRRVAKTIFFGSSYGMGAQKFKRLLLVQNHQEFEVSEVQKMLDAFYETYSGMTNWKKDVMRYAGKTGFVVTINGRKRRLPGVFSQDRTEKSRAQRQAVNAVVQGSCADILFEAMTLIQPAFKSLGGSLVASVHDELVGELPTENVEVGAHIMEYLMTAKANQKLRVKLSAEAHHGDDWLSAKKG